MLAGVVSPSAHRTRSPVTGAAAQVFGSRCEAPAANAACPRLSGSGVFVRIVAAEPPMHDLCVQPIFVRGGKVRPAGRAGSTTIRGVQRLSSDSAGRLTRRLRRRCSHGESPHAPSPREAHSPRPASPVPNEPKNIDFPLRAHLFSSST